MYRWCDGQHTVGSAVRDPVGLVGYPILSELPRPTYQHVTAALTNTNNHIYVTHGYIYI